MIQIPSLVEIVYLLFTQNINRSISTYRHVVATYHLLISNTFVIIYIIYCVDILYFQYYYVIITKIITTTFNINSHAQNNNNNTFYINKYKTIHTIMTTYNQLSYTKIIDILSKWKDEYPNLIKIYNAQDTFGIPSPGTCASFLPCKQYLSLIHI